MTDTYPYAEKRANARRWLKQRGVIAYMGDRWLLAQPQPRKQALKRLPSPAFEVGDVLDIKVPLRRLVRK